MILSSFLSRQIEDDSNLHEIIPMSFNIWKILEESYHIVADTYKVPTRTQAKAQVNAPAAANTQPVAPTAVPKMVKLSIKTEKEKDSPTTSKMHCSASRSPNCPAAKC